MKLKITGVILFLTILVLLFLSLFTNIYEFPEDELIGNINDNGVTVLTAIYLFISLLSAIYALLNGFKKNKTIAYPIYIIGVLSFMRLIYILIFYLEK